MAKILLIDLTNEIREECDKIEKVKKQKMEKIHYVSKEESAVKVLPEKKEDKDIRIALGLMIKRDPNLGVSVAG